MVPGLVGPKPRRIGVGDGHQVNIPEQVFIVNSSQYVTGAVSWFNRLSFSGTRVRIRGTPMGVSILGIAMARKAD